MYHWVGERGEFDVFRPDRERTRGVPAGVASRARSRSLRERLSDASFEARRKKKLSSYAPRPRDFRPFASSPPAVVVVVRSHPGGVYFCRRSSSAPSRRESFEPRARPRGDSPRGATTPPRRRFRHRREFRRILRPDVVENVHLAHRARRQSTASADATRRSRGVGTLRRRLRRTRPILLPVARRVRRDARPRPARASSRRSAGYRRGRASRPPSRPAAWRRRPPRATRSRANRGASARAADARGAG